MTNGNMNNFSKRTDSKSNENNNSGLEEYNWLNNLYISSNKNLQKSDSKLLSQNSEVMTNKLNESFNSQISKENDQNNKIERKPDPVLFSSKKENQHTFSSMSSVKGEIWNSVGRSSTRSQSKQKGKIVKNTENLHQTDSLINISTDVRSAKRYMHPTNSSVKKATRNSSVSSMLSKSKLKDLKSKSNKIEIRRNPDIFILFFQRLKQHQAKILASSKNNKTIKLVFFVFSPYIVTLIAMLRLYMSKCKDPKPRGASQGYQKHYRDDGMLLDLKNAELEEERRKIFELKKSNELLKKRVYSKNEFEAQYKSIKAEKEEFEAKLKVSEKIRKQQKNLIKELQSQINKLRKDKKVITTKSAKPMRDSNKIESENIDSNAHIKLTEAQIKEKKIVMMPVYSSIPEVDDSRDNSRIQSDMDNSKIPTKDSVKQNTKAVAAVKKDTNKAKKTTKQKPKKEKDVKVSKKLMR